MNSRTIAYIRQQLRFQAPDLDEVLDLPPGTVAAAEKGETKLEPAVVMKLRHYITLAEQAGNLPQRHIGMLIRQARVAMGLTQKEVAEKCGMSQTTLSAVERATNPRYSTIQRVADAIGVPWEWILRGKPLNERE
jgi:DNA-binding XRE family transcriptional regulator